MRRTVMLSFIGALASGVSLASAESILIDFESLPTGTTASLTPTPAPLTSPVTFLVTNGSDITVSDLSSISGAITFGTRSISAANTLLIEFPSAVSSVSVEAGHDDGTSYNLTLNAFGSANGMGTALGSDTEPLPAVGTLFNSTTLEVDQSGIMSAEISGGGTGVFFDNVGFTTGAINGGGGTGTGTGGGGGTQAVPLPDSAMMFPLGAACAGFVMYRNRRRMARA